MKVLGIDPGYGRCGMAIIERENGNDFLRDSRCVETSPQQSFPERLAEIIGTCRKMIEDHSPHSFAIEKLYFNTNQKTAMQVAEVRGALISCAAESGLSVHEYTPGQVKNATSGFGRADKKQIASMLHLLIKIEKPIKHDDEYDAIAVALTHLAHARISSGVEQTEKSR